MMTVLEPLLEYAATEEKFEAAYVALSAQERSWIKQAIAKWVAIYGLGRNRKTELETTWPGQLKLIRRQQPLAWVVALVMEEGLSWAQVLAAVLPAYLAGVPQVFICLSEQAVSFPLLAAFELAGLEQVLIVSRNQVKNLLLSAGWQEESGLVVTLGKPLVTSAHHSLQAGGNWFHLGARPKIGVWIEDAQDWNFEMLDFAHGPSRPFFFASRQDIKKLLLKKEVEVAICPWEQFTGQGFSAIYLPDQYVNDFEGCQLLLRKGQENFWLWPKVGPGLFLDNALQVACGG